MLTQILTVLAALAIPAALIAVVDDWFLRPPRRIGGGAKAEAPLLAANYYVLPFLLMAALLRLLLSERLDFSLVLVTVVAVAGLVWLLDHLLFEPARRRAATAAGRDPASLPLPVTVDYARSFFPVAVIVLLVRSFIFEPFRIPSDSMMPTLVDGDFIIVNKFAYGLRLPVINRKVVAIGEPQRGDVVVFRYPPDPRINYIKRLGGLPGDHVQVKDDKLIVNGQSVATTDLGQYEDGCYEGMHLSAEQLGQHRLQIMFCPTPGEIGAEPLPTCNRNPPISYVCVAQQLPGQPD